jgi:hypothetical protein
MLIQLLLQSLEQELEQPYQVQRIEVLPHNIIEQLIAFKNDL